MSKEQRDLGSYEKSLNIENSFDFQYYGTLYMGSEKQPLTFIFDTGSAWLWIPTDACPKEQCTGNRFHYGTSTTYTPYEDEKHTVTYGNG